MKRTLLRIAFSLVAAAALTNCFQILHYLRMNSDGTMSVTWRFSMASAMRKQMSEKKEGPGKTSSDVAGNITRSIFDKSGALEELLKAHGSGVSVRLVESEYDVTQEVSFSAKAGAPVPDHDGLPIFPKYNAKTKELVFDFIKMAEKNKKKKEAKEGEDAKAEKKNPQAEKVAALFLSTARYQVVLDGMSVKNAFVVNAKSGKKVRIQPSPLGGLTLIDFPFLSALSMEEDGFQLIIELR